MAGRRAGLAGERSGLWWEFHRVLDELRPEWVLIENVPGLLSSNEGRDLSAILGALAELGYMGAYRVLDSQYFGVAQRRHRVFIVGHLGDGRRAAEVLFDAASLQRHPPTGREAGARVAAPVAGSSPGGSGYRNDADTAARNVVFGGNRISGDRDQATGLNSHAGRYDFETENIVTHALTDPMYTLDGTGAQAIQCHGSNVGPMGSLRAGNGNEAGGVPVVAFNCQQDPVSGDLARMPVGGCDQAVAFAENQRGELRTSEISPQLTTGGGKPGQGYPAVAFTERSREQGRTLEASEELSHALMNPGSGGRTHSRQIMDTLARPRRLTPLECERLQGLPDNYTQVNGVKDGPRYRMLGDAVTASAAEWIGKRILQAR